MIGDSAAPVYFDRERVPVEMLPEPTQHFRNDTVYVFYLEEEDGGGDFMLKRLRRMPGGKVEAESLNPGLKPFIFSPTSAHDFAVVAIAREPTKQQLYASLIGRFMRNER